METQKPTEGTDVKSPITLGANQMATLKKQKVVTYRGIPYNPDEYKAQVLAQAEQERNHELMYRGLKHTARRK